MSRYRPALALSASLAMAASVAPSSAFAQESALRELRTAAQSRDPQATLRLARALRRAGHFAEAITTLRPLARGPVGAEALWEIARVRLAEGNYRASQAACRALPRGRGPADAATVLQRVCMGYAHLVWHRPALAERELAAVRAANPQSAELLLLVADTHQQLGHLADAETAYRAAVTALPDRAEPHIGLASVLEQTERPDDALAEYRRAVEVDATDPAAALALGRFLLARRNDALGARPYLERASQDRPDWPEALVALGEAQVASGSAGEAAQTYRRAVQVMATAPGAQRGLGRALLRDGHAAEAERVLRTALEQVPNDVDARITLGDTLAQLGQNEGAIEEYNRAIDARPRDSTARLSAARLARTMGQDSLARAYLDRILSDDASLSPALALRADIAFDGNDRTAARRWYQAALAGHGEFDRARVEGRIRELDAPSGRPRRR